MLTVYWCGYGGGSWMAERFREMIENELGMKLVTLHEHPDANIKWDLNTVYDELKKADIIILPANFRRQPCKSNNRLTQAMALGKPVICDPMPSYIPVIKQGVNGFITVGGTQDEYRLLLKMLRDDKPLREKLGKEAAITAKSYSLENTSRKWLLALSKLPKKATDPKAVDVIIPTKNNNTILEKCLDSFANSTLTEEIYIVDNGDGPELAELVKKYNVPVVIKDI